MPFSQNHYEGQMKWFIGSAAFNFKLYGKTNILTLLLRHVAFIPWVAQFQVVRSSFRENIWLMVWVAVSGCRASVWEGGLSAGVWPGDINYIWELGLRGESAERNLGESHRWGTRWNRLRTTIGGGEWSVPVTETGDGVAAGRWVVT